MCYDQLQVKLSCHCHTLHVHLHCLLGNTGGAGGGVARLEGIGRSSRSLKAEFLRLGMRLAEVSVLGFLLIGSLPGASVEAVTTLLFTDDRMILSSPVELLLDVRDRPVGVRLGG